jgi:hypothetical protein
MTYEEMLNYIISLCQAGTPPNEDQQESVLQIMAKVRENDNVRTQTLLQIGEACKQLSWRLSDWDNNKPYPIDTSFGGCGVNVMMGNDKVGII